MCRNWWQCSLEGHALAVVVKLESERREKEERMGWD